jgi:hypothetical protein
MTILGKPTKEQVRPFFGTSQALVNQLKRINGDRIDVNYIVRNGNITVNAQTEEAVKFIQNLEIPEFWDEGAKQELTHHYNCKVCSSVWEAKARIPEYLDSFVIGNKIYYP